MSGKNRHYKISEIHARHFRALLQRVGGDELWQAACAMVERAPGTLAQIVDSLPPNFPEIVAETITKGVAEQGRRFLQGSAQL